MATIYVNQSDSNATDSSSNTGTNSAIPLRTFAASFTRAVAGDTVIVLDSTEYAEQLTCTLVGTASSPITFRPDTGITPTFTGAQNARWILKLLGAKYTIWDGFRFSYGFSIPPVGSSGDTKAGKFPWIHLQGATTQFNAIKNCTIEHTAYLGAAISGYAAAGWDEWGIKDNDARYTWIYRCTIGGVGQGIQLTETDLFALVEECTIGPTYQSCITTGTSNSVICKRWIKNCTLFDSYAEDGIQQTQSFAAGVDQTTDKSNVGLYISGTTIKGCNENAYDEKGARLTWMDSCVIYEIKGSNNGLESGGNRSSLFAIGRGANTSCSEIAIRNSYIYDCPTVAIRGQKTALIHNVILNNNRDYTGANSTFTNTVTPPFKSIFHQDAPTSGIIANNIIGKCNTGTIFMRLNSGEFHIDGNMHVDDLPGNWTGTSYSTYATLGDWQAAVQATTWNTTGEASAQFVANTAAVAFVSVPEYPSGAFAGMNFTLGSGSPAIGAGVYIDKAIGAGVNSRFISVTYPSAFFDGFGWQGASFPNTWASWSDMQGDHITILNPSGLPQSRQILNINYDTGVIEIDEAATWNGGAEIYLGSSDAPNLGPLQAGVAGGGGGGGTGSGTGQKITYHTTCATSSGNQTITLPVTLASAPKLVMFTVTNGVTNGTNANHAMLCRGFWITGGTNYATAIVSETGISGQNSARRTVTDGCILILTSTNTVDGKATVDSVSTTQVVINWSNPPASAFQLTLDVYDCAEVYMTNATLPTVTYNEGSGVGYTTVTPGFEPDEIYVTTVAKSNPANNARAKFSEGWATYDGTTLRQAGWVYVSNDVAGGTNTGVSAEVLSDSVIGEIADTLNSLNRTIQIKNVGATTFRLASVVGDWSGGADAFVVCVRWAGLSTYVGVVSMPTATGLTTFGDGNFLGQHVNMLISNLTAVDTLDQTGPAGAMAYYSADGTREGSQAWSDKDNVATSVTRSLADNNLNTLQHDATAAFTATFDSFQGSGPKLNFSAVMATATKTIMLLTGAAGGSASATDSGYADDFAVAQKVVQINALDAGFGDDFAGGNANLTVVSIAALDEGFGDDFASGVASTPTAAFRRRPVKSFNKGKTLTFNVYDPLPMGTQQVDDITNNVIEYSHDINAIGGFWSASIRLKDSLAVFDDWVERGIGRRIVVYGPENQTVWEGFVNRLTLRLGSSQRSIGPLLAVVNRVKLNYSYIAAGGTNIGVRAETDWASNTTSQARYGILSKVLSTGGASIVTAGSLRDDYLRENAYHETSGDHDFGQGGGEPTLELECLGYYHFLQTYFVALTTTGTTTLSAQLQTVLDAEPNGFITQTWSHLTSNSLVVPAYDNDDRDAMNVIKNLVAKGDANDNRYLFGVYESRLPYYTQASTAIDYIQYMSDPYDRVMYPGGQTVQPWDVRPGRWLFSPDFMIGRVPNNALLNDDPRAEFIESVTYRMPMTLFLRGNKVRRLDQKLAKFGLSGLGG